MSLSTDAPSAEITAAQLAHEAFIASVSLGGKSSMDRFYDAVDRELNALRAERDELTKKVDRVRQYARESKYVWPAGRDDLVRICDLDEPWTRD